ncbi:MAG: di-trans,poly-cis-decaprenylcistransferase [Gammaproteobacteria bacterium]|nr:MAG: di-trans,poly-cis-decaprenylcistransferase [Gammaproteobacteria bacterium]
MNQTEAGSSGGHPLRHVAIIMDGNNRWAKERGLSGTAGHEVGVERVRDVLDACQRHSIDVVTLFAFSSENWQRPELEVRALMSLLSSYLRKEVPQLVERGVCLRFIGRRDNFSDKLKAQLAESEAATAGGSRTLVLAVDYGGRWEITEAARNLARQVQTGRLRPEDISEQLLQQQMCLKDLPPPDLCIRTAGEQRISNFLLWHIAYTEFYFADCYWPDFDGDAFDQAVTNYYQRQRRFGMRNSQPEENGKRA